MVRTGYLRGSICGSKSHPLYTGLYILTHSPGVMSAGIFRLSIMDKCPVVFPPSVMSEHVLPSLPSHFAGKDWGTR
jgi:hypothetical protein